MKMRATIVLAALALSGCASIFSGSTQDVAIRATPGAKYVVTDSAGRKVASGEVPGTVNLARGAGYFSPNAYKVNLSKPGYQNKTLEVNPGMNGWYFANILLGGFVGMVIVDPLTGAMYNLLPREIDTELEPTGEDVSTLGYEAEIIARTRNYPVSRYDYMARQKARELHCTPLGNPAVEGLGSAVEKLSFECQEHRQLRLQCLSNLGCTQT